VIQTSGHLGGIDAAYPDKTMQNGRTGMKSLIAIAAALMLCSAAAFAVSCQDQATAKKLAGAALKSFMTKCEKDAAGRCQKASADKKLAGAAKTSFETKCLKDAVGSKP
jgi:hypothetical protein